MKHITLWLVLAGIVLLGIVVYAIVHVNTVVPIPVPEISATSTEQINMNACGEGISIEDCNMDKDK